ncbi:hypothetical protein PORUE0001_0800 [Porphyromonas uenonis 60-3]|uniref:Uncharacterized protein n=1 Tax=Porphyromonas uenonis 60-3 TaxID=596327 RepID=C2MEH6_9PORP|nr:hypothetical protein PORUE0001_0800 [Porphyromonas uenonis 60-3]
MRSVLYREVEMFSLASLRLSFAQGLFRSVSHGEDDPQPHE